VDDVPEPDAERPRHTFYALLERNYSGTRELQYLISQAHSASPAGLDVLQPVRLSPEVEGDHDSVLSAERTERRVPNQAGPTTDVFEVGERRMRDEAEDDLVDVVRMYSTQDSRESHSAPGHQYWQCRLRAALLAVNHALRPAKVMRRTWVGDMCLKLESRPQVAFRKLAVRYGRHADTVLALRYLACALICLRYLAHAEAATH
jgi:hypothetical protein